jgi:hypothetical protein
MTEKLDTGRCHTSNFVFCIYICKCRPALRMTFRLDIHKMMDKGHKLSVGEFPHVDPDIVTILRWQIEVAGNLALL